MGKGRINLRVSDEATISTLREKAKMAGLNLSEFMRRAALGRRINCVVDQRMIGELRRLGAMLKHRYPKNSNWTLEEKRQYWAALERIMDLANHLETLIKGHRG